MNEYQYDDIEIGQEESFSVMIDQDKMELFRSITEDTNPLHNDSDFAIREGIYLPGKWSLIYDVEIGMIAPVYIGDELTVSGIVIDKDDAYKMIFLKLQIKNQKGKKVSKGKMRVIVRK